MDARTCSCVFKKNDSDRAIFASKIISGHDVGRVEAAV